MGLDLLPPAEFEEIVDVKGTLKVAEILVGRQMWDDGSFRLDIDLGRTEYHTDLFFFGKLSDRTNVRVTKRKIIVPTYHVDDEDTKGLETRALEIKDLIEKKYPKAGDVLAVSWFSEGMEPKFFRNDSYVDPITCIIPTKGISFISRADILTETYLNSILANLPRESSYTQAVNRTLSYRDEYAKSRDRIKASLTRKVIDYFDLTKLSLGEIKDYVQTNNLIRSELTDFLESHKTEMNYREMLALFASWDMPKQMAQIWYNICRLKRLPKSSDKATFEIHKIGMLEDRLYENLIDNLRELFQRKECQQIGIIDVIYQAKSAMSSAFSEVYQAEMRLPTVWGSYGGWERRHEPTVKQKGS